MFLLVMGILLLLSASTGAFLIGYFFILRKPHHDYWCHTDNISPNNSHGNIEPHI